MNIKHCALIAVTAALTLPTLVAAQEAHSAKQINVRAGPARDYPLVASYGPETPFTVQGCTSGYGWCDVIAPDGVRGWVFAGNLFYPFQDQERPLQMYGSVVGIPILTFSLGSYWGSYYPSRPWFRDRGRWEHHAPPRPPVRPVMRPPPAPRPQAGHPPGDNRPPPAAHPPQGRPPQGRPAGRPAGSERPPGDRGPNDRRGDGPRPPER